jgi:hypothetical protein
MKELRITTKRVWEQEKGSYSISINFPFMYPINWKSLNVQSGKNIGFREKYFRM